jgi:hypothetical protein
MVKDKRKELPEPTWKEQLYGYGFTDEDIDAVNEIPLHRFLIRMNLTFQDALILTLKDQNKDFHNKMIEDVREVITQELTPIQKDVKEIKDNMALMKQENDRDHEEFKDHIGKLLFTNRWWMILLRLVTTGIILFFLVKYAHGHWWPNYSLSLFCNGI